MYLNGEKLITCENNNRFLIGQVKEKLLECSVNHRNVDANCGIMEDSIRSDIVKNEEVLALRNKFPTKIPIVIKRFQKEMQLPHLDKYKFLVPQEITMSQFQTIIRSRLKMGPNQALYLLVNNRSMLSLSLTLAEVYNNHAGPDGFLYITYASQEVFGYD